MRTVRTRYKKCICSKQRGGLCKNFQMKRNFAMMMRITRMMRMNCDDCSACCKWVILHGKPTGDNKRLWELRKAVFIDDFVLLPSVCSRLDGVRNRCTIYDRRPNICREFAKDCVECRICRKAEGLDVKLNKSD